MSRRRRLIGLSLVASVLVLPAYAGDAADPSLVAGYKALFTCSATFLAHRTQQQISRDMLTGIYPEYEEGMVQTPAATIDAANHVVKVAYADDMPPRTAKWRDGLGCSLLPPGADADMPVPSLSLPAPGNESGQPWPLGDQLPGTPAGADASGSPLAHTLARAFDGRTYGNGSRTSAVLVTSGTAILGEAYSPDSGRDVPQRTWSVAKTIMAALVGIAVGDGLLNQSAPAPIASWSVPGDPRGAIRIIDLMHMASGLDAGPVGSRTDQVYFGGGRVPDHALTHELVARPGQRWFYANNDVLALSFALRSRLHDDGAYLAFPHLRLFRPIGMLHTTAETDWDGTYVFSSQVWSTARDLARLGVLLLNQGAWQGRQILPAGWVRLMTMPAPVQPPAARPDGTPSPGYGGLVWLFGTRHGLPEGTFAAMGNRGQYVVVIPARGLVVVRRGFDAPGGSFNIAKFSADVLAAIQ